MVLSLQQLKQMLSIYNWKQYLKKLQSIKKKKKSK